MKKLISIIAFTLLCTSFYGDDEAGQQKEEVSQTESQTDSENKAEEVPPADQENPDFAKLDRVISKMSERAKKEIKIQDKQAFLEDFYKVLEEEKNFPKDDISLYYLIDKQHNIENDDTVGKELRDKNGHYTPKNLKKLVRNDLFKISRLDLSLRPDVYQGLNKMAAAYKKETGDKLLVISTYRSYNYQVNLFNRWAASDPEGEKGAERYSARAGTSQHQLGTAIDFCKLDNSFVNEKMGKWLNTHSEEYGWSLSFPKGYEPITGYQYECWHFRYIGIPACQLQKKYFNDIQQYLFEFIYLWKNETESNK